MKKYDIEVTMKYRFTVEAESPYEAYQEAQEWDNVSGNELNHRERIEQ